MEGLRFPLMSLQMFLFFFFLESTSVSFRKVEINFFPIWTGCLSATLLLSPYISALVVYAKLIPPGEKHSSGLHLIPIPMQSYSISPLKYSHTQPATSPFCIIACITLHVLHFSILKKLKVKDQHGSIDHTSFLAFSASWRACSRSRVRTFVMSSLAASLPFCAILANSSFSIFCCHSCL